MKRRLIQWLARQLRAHGAHLQEELEIEKLKRELKALKRELAQAKRTFVAKKDVPPGPSDLTTKKAVVNALLTTVQATSL